jgi:hypothetical protein
VQYILLRLSKSKNSTSNILSKQWNNSPNESPKEDSEKISNKIKTKNKPKNKDIGEDLKEYLKMEALFQKEQIHNLRRAFDRLQEHGKEILKYYFTGVKEWADVLKGACKLFYRFFELVGGVLWVGGISDF